MYAEGGKLNVVKGLFSFNAFMDAYEEHKKKKCVLHFRIRTHGDIDEENCHPYIVDRNLAFVHNGIIGSVQGEDHSKSDTWYFNERFLKGFRKYDKSFFKRESYKTLIDSFIGHSKLVFLNSKGEHEIVNERAGNWDSNVWFSNLSWKARRYTPPVTTVYHGTYVPKSENETTKIVPYKKDCSLTVGDVCWVTTATERFKYAEYCRIKYVYSDNTVGVESTEKDKEERIPFWNLIKTTITNYPEKVEVKLFEVGDFVMFDKNWNHFKAFDDVTVLSDDGGEYVNVYDEVKQKEYRVPKRLLSDPISY